MTTSKHITPYQDLAIQEANHDSLRQLACAIILSAIDAADIEFLTDDYDEWKKYRIKRMKKNECLNELDFQLEFKGKQTYKESLFDICEITTRVSDIPQDRIDERRMYETNQMKTLIKLTNYKKETLINNAKLHGWKIGIDYAEPSMFDDDF